jgi:type VI secretion system secreted protein VgrG
MATFAPANAPRFLFRVGSTELMVVAFRVEEQVSAPFSADLKLASEDPVRFDDMVGEIGLLTMESGDSDRYLHGIVSRFVQSGVDGRLLLYEACIVPQCHLFLFEQDCRIFQNKSVPDIVKEVLEEGGMTGDLFDFRLQGSYTPREYCVQYRESDLHFVSRLLEEEGIFYFFEHSAEKHLMVFGDGTVNYQPIAGQARVVFNPGSGMVAEEEAVLGFRLARQIRSGKYTLRDFNFEKPSLDLTADHADQENKQREIYDYPGEYTTTEAGRQLALVRLQQAVLFKERAQGSSVVPRFIPGFTFALHGHELDAFNKEYLLVEVVHTGAQPQVLAEKAAAQDGTRFENEFVAIPSTTTLRPEIRTPKPVVEGVQTAIVTGPAGEEIYTDKHGRVKVQFHWDRRGKNDEKSSCWIRVSQAWAGAGWGAMFIPRIGQEVIVDFIEGDPDRPIITGRVYHGTNTPPYDLPDEKTKSTIKSDSSTGGDGFNELRFEDKKNGEEIYLHAQKDWSIAVRNDKRQTVGNDDSLSVGHDRTQDVKNDLSESVGHNKSIIVSENQKEDIGKNFTLTVGQDCNESIGNNNEVSIGASRSVTIEKDLQNTVGKNISVSAGEKLSESAGGDMDLQAGKKLVISAGGNIVVNGDKQGTIELRDQLTIQCGNASITMNKNGDIDIVGKKINIKGSSDVIVKGTSIKEN